MSIYVDFLTALTIFADHQKGQRQAVTAEHDTIWAGHGLSPDDLSAGNLRALALAGWTWDEEVGAWRRYL